MTTQGRARLRFALLAFLALSATPSRADDSTAALKAGGLVLEKTDKIALVSEDLYLSPTAVKVAYRFRNVTNADIETTVAFAMPDVTGRVDMTVAMPDPGHDNFLDFTTRVDGKPVDSQVEQRAFLRHDQSPFKVYYCSASHRIRTTGYLPGPLSRTCSPDYREHDGYRLFIRRGCGGRRCLCPRWLAW